MSAKQRLLGLEQGLLNSGCLKLRWGPDIVVEVPNHRNPNQNTSTPTSKTIKAESQASPLLGARLHMRDDGAEVVAAQNPARAQTDANLSVLSFRIPSPLPSLLFVATDLNASQLGRISFLSRGTSGRHFSRVDFFRGFCCFGGFRTCPDRRRRRSVRDK